MQVLFWGMFTTCLAFFLHLAIWKIRLPRRQVKTLLIVFFSTLVITLLVLWQFQSAINIIGIKAPQTIYEYLHIALFFISLTLAYMITYTALEADSPSLVMVMSIAKAGEKGLPINEFEAKMTDEILVKPRIDDLLLNKLADFDGEKYTLSPKGVLFARIFSIYRQILNAKKGG